MHARGIYILSEVVDQSVRRKTVPAVALVPRTSQHASGRAQLLNPSAYPVGLQLIVGGPADTVTIAYPETGRGLYLDNPDGPLLDVGQFLTIDTATRQVLLMGDASVLMAVNKSLRWLCSGTQVKRPGLATRALGIPTVVTPPVGSGPYGNGALVTLPQQPFALLWDDAIPAGFNIVNWGQPGRIVGAGRANYGNQVFKDLSAAGVNVPIYIDVMISNADGTPNYGRYHNLLGTANAYGAAVPFWPGPIKANTWGNINDFRTTSPMHQTTTDAAGAAKGWTKLEAILELAVSENPHIGGFFADDLGSRSYFPGTTNDGDVIWNGFTTAQQQSYRDGAIMALQTFRRVCDRHKMSLIVNGSWAAGTLASKGGGYPDLAQMGCSLAESGFWEHHVYDAYGESYVVGAQWGVGTPGGKNFTLVAANSDADAVTWRNRGTIPYLADVSSSHGAVDPWGAAHASGLPTKAVL